MVEVDVAHRAEKRVRGIAVHERIGKAVAAPRRVHAATDVDDVARERDISRIEAVGRERRLGNIGVEVGSRPHVLARQGVDGDAGVLRLPRVGEAVDIGVYRARVHAAAAHAAGDGVLGIAVDERHAGLGGRNNIGDAAVIPRSAPRHALIAVEDSVAVGVWIVRVGREELVEPALLEAISNRMEAGMVVVDRRAVLVGVAGVGAGIFRSPAELVGRAVDLLLVPRLVKALPADSRRPGRRRVRVAALVELPAVRHSVAVGVGAMALDGAPRAAGLCERVREILGYVRGRREVRGSFRVVRCRALRVVGRVQDRLDVRLRVHDVGLRRESEER